MSHVSHHQVLSDFHYKNKTGCQYHWRALLKYSAPEQELTLLFQRFFSAMLKKACKEGLC